jgi:hypothetical protein
MSSPAAYTFVLRALYNIAPVDWFCGSALALEIECECGEVTRTQLLHKFKTT